MTKNGNGGNHAITVSIALGVAGVLVTIMLAIVNSIGTRIDEVRLGSLSIREHVEYKANQEAASRRNQERIDHLENRIYELQHQIDRGCTGSR